MQIAQWSEFLESDDYKRLPHWLAHSHLPHRPTTQWFRYQHDDADKPEQRIDMNVSEDFWFFHQARTAGFKCYCDWDCECQHIGQQAIDGSWNAPFINKQMAEYENPDTRDTVLNNTIVCGYPDGMVLGDGECRVPPYVVTEGER